MAANTQRHQIVFIIGAARRDWILVMHQFCHHILPMLLAYLAKGVTADVSVPDLSPTAAVPLVLVIATGKFLVVPFHHLAVVYTVTTLVIGQLWATAISAWPLWFHGHGLHLNYYQ